MSCQCKSGNTNQSCLNQNGYIVPNGSSNNGQCQNQGKTNHYSNTYDVNGASYSVNNENYYKNYYNRYNHYYVTDTNHITDYITDYNVYHVMQPNNYSQAYTVGTYTVIDNGCMPVAPCANTNRPPCQNYTNVVESQKKYMCK